MCYNNSKYKNWLEQQEKEFIQEVCQGQHIPTSYIDFNYQATSLEELKQLDEKFIHNSPAGEENNNE